MTQAVCQLQDGCKQLKYMRNDPKPSGESSPMECCSHLLAYRREAGATPE